MAQVIFLNGASSSGKTTLTKALQSHLEKPYLHFSEDTFFSMLPEKPLSQDEFMTYGLRVYEGFARAAKVMVECQNNLIVDTVAWHPESMTGFVRAFAGIKVLAVGVHCDLEILEIREQQRGNRTAGLAKKQFDQVHAQALYDIEIDTSKMSIKQCVELILQAFEHQKPNHAFAIMYKQLKS